MFKGGQIWGVIVNINSALVGIGYGLLVLFFAIGIFSSAASFRELQRPKFALRHFIRFVLAKVAVGRDMELMTAIFSICGSVASASMNSIGGGVTTTAALLAEIVSAIEDVGFLQSIPLWLVSFLGSLLIPALMARHRVKRPAISIEGGTIHISYGAACPAAGCPLPWKTS